MKRFSVLLVLVILFVSLSPYVFSAYSESLDGLPENCLTLPENYSHINSFDMSKKSTKLYTAKYFSANNPDFNLDCTEFFGKLLNKYEKVFYDKLATVNYTTRTISVDFGKNLTEEQFNQIEIQRIADAFFLDKPEFFWLTDFSIYYNTVDTKSGEKEYNDFTIVLSVGLEYNDLFNPLNKRIQKFYNEIGNLNLSFASRYDFYKSLHDCLCNKVTYNLFASRCFDAYGALVDGKAVCQGYSEAFKVVCDIYNVPCICVIGYSQGENHMWNAVQKEDGKWYFIDCTWDDDNTVIYDYFLCGMNSVDSRDEKFSVSHEIRYKNTEDEQYNCLFLQYPVFSLNGFEVTGDNHFNGFSLTKNVLCDNFNKIIYTSYFSEKTDVFYNGLFYGTHTTGPEFKGDIDGDGIVTAEDALSALKIHLKNTDFGEEQFNKADINGDGVVSIAESRKILRVSADIDNPNDFIITKNTENKIEVFDENNKITEFTVLRFGDVNNDLLCNTDDYLTVCEKAKNNTEVITTEDFLCDADGNGIINSVDSDLYLKAVNGEYKFTERFKEA